MTSIGAGHSIAIDFWVHDSIIHSASSRASLQDRLCNLLKPSIGNLQKVTEASLPGKSFLGLFGGEKDSSLSIKCYDNGLVSATYDYFTSDINMQLFGVDDGLKLEQKINDKLEAKFARVLPALKRGLEHNVYFATSDNRLLEYDIDETVFSKTSEFQKVEIAHSKSFGNILVLDNMQNLAESDLAYTHGLMNKDSDMYEDKTVLILGGGDGALLYELLKENPKHVLMIDIDEAVMEGCRKHLRSACGTVLDNYQGSNYEVIVGDAFKYLAQYIEEGRRFDFVFADLPDVPVSQEEVGDLWELLGSVMKLGIDVLTPGTGRYMTHAIGNTMTSSVAMFEKKLGEQPVHALKQTQRYVPSFMETWVFFQATKNDSK